MTGLVMIAAGNVLGIAMIAGVCMVLSAGLNAIDKLVMGTCIA